MQEVRAFLELRLKPVLSRQAGAALGIWGEPGIGKTHLSVALLRSTPCRSLSVHAAAPVSSWMARLPQTRKLPGWAEQNLKRLMQGESLEPNLAVAALTALMTEAAPFVLHLDDLHETSPEQMELWEALAQTVLRSKGLALLVSSRTQPPEVFSPYRLDPLSAGENQALLEAEAGASLPQTALGWIFTKAKGNPLFGLEYFRFLARQGHLWSDGKIWHWRSPPENLLPVSVEALIEQWLAEASQDPLLEKALSARALLPQAGPVTWATIAGVTQEELEEATRQLEAREILCQGRFVHPLYLEVMLKNLHAPLRQTLARQIIQTLSEGDPQTAARFVREAGLVAQPALELLKRASQSARDAGNAPQAGRFLAQATDYVQGDERGRLAFEAAQLLQSADYPQTMRMCELALSQLPTDIDLIWYTADMYGEQGQPELAHKILERLPPENRSGPDWIIRKLASPIGDVKGKVELWNAHLEVHNLTDPLVVYRVAYALSAMGEQEQARKMALQVLQREDLAPVRQAQMYSIVGSTFYKEQRAKEAVEWNQKALELLRSIGHQRGIAAVLGNQAHALEDLDRYKEALANYQEALQILNQLGNPFDYAVPLLNIGVFQHWFGEYQQAEALLLEATSIFSKAGVTEYLVDCGEVLCNLYLDWNQPHGVFLSKKYAQMGWEVAQTLGAPGILLRALVPLARAERVAGNLGQALELAEQACVLSDQLEPPKHSPYLERALCLEALERKDKAMEQLRFAETIALAEGRATSIDGVGLHLDRLTGNVDVAMERLERFKKLGFINTLRVALREFPALVARFQQETAPVQSLAQNTLRLEALGPLRLEGRSVQGGKRQELLGVLLEGRLAGRSEVRQLDLLDALYPDEAEEKAQVALKKLIHTVRSGLGQELILTTSGGYALGAVDSDAEEFLKTGQAELWRGVWLEGLQTRHEAVSELLYAALAQTVQKLLEHNPAEAVRLSRILLEAEPYEQGYLRLGLQALRANHNHKSLNRAYQEAKARMLEVGQVLPEHWSEYLV